MKKENYIWDYRNPYEWMRKVRTSSFSPLIVCCAISGGVQGKEYNINLPETPEEQAEQTYEAYRAGTSMVHIHARDPKMWYEGTGDPEQYRITHALIREKCPDIIINDTTGGSFGMTLEQRISCLDANPEVATLNMGPDMAKMIIKERKAPIPHPRPEIHLDTCDVNTYESISAFAKAMRNRGIKPEIEIYNPGMYWVFWDLLNQGLLTPPHLIQFVMGYQTSSYATPANLISLVNELPPESIFEVCGVGVYQLPMNVMALVLGAHIIRVGMEDSVYYRRGQLLKSNAEAVERIVRIAKDMNREIATPAQAREILGLSQKPTKY
jgi:3-keto-5-aminohexanoate cleavage enzyme